MTGNDDFALADLRLFDPEDILGNALADVAHVDRTTAEVFIFHLLENLSLRLVSVEHRARSTAALVDLLIDRAAHCRVFDHHAMRLEDRRLLLHVLLIEIVDRRNEFCRNLHERVRRDLFLVSFFLRLVIFEIAVEVLPREHDLADRYAGDNAFALHFLCHLNSPVDIQREAALKKRLLPPNIYCL